MQLDVEAAHRSLSGLGAHLGVDRGPRRRGVLRYRVAQMSHALRLVTLRRGHDPRDFTLVAYGGAGPLHAALLARELGVARTVIPPAPGHFSALGMLLGDCARTPFERSSGRSSRPVGPLFDALERRRRRSSNRRPAIVARSGSHVSLRRPGALVEVTLGQDGSTRAPRAPAGAFDAASEETYAFSLSTAVEIVEARVSVSAARGEPVEWSTAPTPAPELRPRDVDLDQHGGVQRATVVERRTLDAGDRLAGPCIVEEPATTVLVLPGQSVTMDELSNLVIEEDT